MTSVAHRFEFDNMSILSHQPNHLAVNSAVCKTTRTLTSFGHSNSVHRHPLLSIPQVQSGNSDASSSKTFVFATKFPSSKPCRPPTYERERRRKARSARTDSPPSAEVPSLRSGKKLTPAGHLDAQHQDPILSSLGDEDVGHELLLPYTRLNLRFPIAPSAPPPIPDHIVIPKSHCAYHYTQVVEPAYEIPRETPKDTHTCIRSEINPHSVSISTQPSVHLSKTLAKLNRVRKTNLPLTPDQQSSSLRMKSSEEREKWWYWSITCPITGDGNQSSHSTPLRCKDLKRKLDVYKDSQELRCEIQTRPMSRFTLGLEKFHYPG